MTNIIIIIISNTRRVSVSVRIGFWWFWWIARHPHWYGFHAFFHRNQDNGQQSDGCVGVCVYGRWFSHPFAEYVARPVEMLEGFRFNSTTKYAHPVVCVTVHQPLHPVCV